MTDAAEEMVRFLIERAIQKSVYVMGDEVMGLKQAENEIVEMIKKVFSSP